MDNPVYRVKAVWKGAVAVGLICRGSTGYGDKEAQTLGCDPQLLRTWPEGRVWRRASGALERKDQASLEAKQLSFVLFVFPSRCQCFRSHSKREVKDAGHSGFATCKHTGQHDGLSTALPFRLALGPGGVKLARFYIHFTLSHSS
jgi:hypothetical protein